MYLIDIKIHQEQVPKNQSTQLLDQHRQWFSKQATYEIQEFQANIIAENFADYQGK